MDTTKKIFNALLIGLLSAIPAGALTAEEVFQNQANSALPDTLEMRLRMTMALPGLSAQTVDLKVLRKGSEKSWTEMKSSVANIRMVQNGSRSMVEDLNTGKKHAASSEELGVSSSLDVSSQLGTAEDYQTPVLDGGFWRLDPVDSAKPTLYYDSTLMRVVEFHQTLSSTQSAVSKIEYAPTGSTTLVPGTPCRIEIISDVSGVQSTVVIEALLSKKRKDILDAVFDVSTQ